MNTVGSDERGLRGLTWLFGMDPNDSPESPLQARMLEEIHQERLNRT